MVLAIPRRLHGCGFERTPRSGAPTHDSWKRLAVGGWERRSRHLPPGAATRHLRRVSSIQSSYVASLVNRPAGQQVN